MTLPHPQDGPSLDSSRCESPRTGHVNLHCPGNSLPFAAPSMSGVERLPGSQTHVPRGCPSSGRNTKTRSTATAEAPDAVSPAPVTTRVSEELLGDLPSHAISLLTIALGHSAPMYRFTVFDKIEIAGPVILPRLADSGPRSAIAMTTTRTPDPTVRVLESEVQGWPSPQVIVSTARLVGMHRAVVLQVEGFLRGLASARPV